PPEKCKMMMEHLPEVTAELQRMEEGNKPLSAEMQTAIAQGGGATFGPANAKVQVVEFSDFHCPCTRTRRSRPRSPSPPTARASSGSSTTSSSRTRTSSIESDSRSRPSR